MKDQFTISLNNLIEKLISWFDLLVVNTPNIILAVLVFLLAYYLSQKLSAWSTKVLRKRIKQSSIRNLIGSLISIFVVVIGIFIALGILNLDKALNSLIAGAGVAGLAVGLALQGTLANTFAGISLALKKVINLGDFIETNGYTGTVEGISLRHTKLKTGDNNIVIIPNSLVADSPFKNFGLTDDIRITIECGIGYESDLDRVEEISKETINKFYAHTNQEIEFYYTEFGDSSINFQMRFWIVGTDQMTFLKARSEAIKLLKRRFEQEGINIPYPITTIIKSNDQD